MPFSSAFYHAHRGEELFQKRDAAEKCRDFVDGEKIK